MGKNMLFSSKFAVKGHFARLKGK